MNYSFLNELSDFFKKTGCKFDKFDLPSDCFDDYFISAVIYLIYIAENKNSVVFDTYYAENINFSLEYFNNSLILVVRTSDGKHELKIGRYDDNEMLCNEKKFIYIVTKFYILKRVMNFSQKCSLITESIHTFMLNGDKKIPESEKKIKFTKYVRSILMSIITYFCAPDCDSSFLKNSFTAFCHCMRNVHLSKLPVDGMVIITLPMKKRFLIKKARIISNYSIEIYECNEDIGEKHIVGFEYAGFIYHGFSKSDWRKLIFLYLIRFSSFGDTVLSYVAAYHTRGSGEKTYDIAVCRLNNQYIGYIRDTALNSNMICCKIGDTCDYQGEFPESRLLSHGCHQIATNDLVDICNLIIGGDAPDSIIGKTNRR